MPKHDNKYTVLFVGAIAIIFALLLSTAATLLKERQETNELLFRKQNVLKAFGFEALGLPEKPKGGDVERVYAARVTAIAVDREGQIRDDVNVATIDAEAEGAKPLSENPVLLVYILSDEDGNPEAYAIPVQGKGLWSTLYGYFALQADLNEVRGLSFYKHGETPGLGGEIESEAFTSQFVGKEIYSPRGNLVSVTVMKGVASATHSGEALKHYADGISGATITSKGVSDMLRDDLQKYEPYFERIRSGEK